MIRVKYLTKSKDRQIRAFVSPKDGQVAIVSRRVDIHSGKVRIAAIHLTAVEVARLVRFTSPNEVLK